jgi:hypothetical protein
MRQLPPEVEDLAAGRSEYLRRQRRFGLVPEPLDAPEARKAHEETC